MNAKLRNNIRLRNAQAGLLLLLVAALLAPIWTVRYLAAGDYPNHLASAFVLAHLNDQGFAFHSFYGSDWNSYPYLMMSGVLVLLQKVVSVDLAGRLLLSLCVLAVPTAAWWFLREVNPGHEMLAVWTLITAQNEFFFLGGFINMQLGFAFCFVVLTGWARFMKNPRFLSWCLLLVGVTALYFTHLLALGMAGLILTAYTLAFQRQHLFTLGALFIPSAAFYLQSASHHGHWNISYNSITGKLAGLSAPVLGFSGWLDLFTFVAVGIAWFWACYRNPDLRWRTPWMLPAALLFGLYWIVPASYGPGLNTDCRFLPFTVVLVLAAVRFGRRLKPLALVALLLFFIRAAALEGYFLRSQPHLEALANVTRLIPSGARVLPVFAHLPPGGQSQVWAFGLIDRGWLSPCLFHDLGVQPLLTKARIYNPYPQAGFCGELKQQKVDWSRIARDYDYLWAYQSPEYEEQLRSVGSVVGVSDGLVLYRLESIASSKVSQPSSRDRKGSVQSGSVRAR